MHQHAAQSLKLQQVQLKLREERERRMAEAAAAATAAGSGGAGGGSGGGSAVPALEKPNQEDVSCSVSTICTLFSSLGCCCQALAGFSLVQ